MSAGGRNQSRGLALSVLSDVVTEPIEVAPALHSGGRATLEGLCERLIATLRVEQTSGHPRARYVVVSRRGPQNGPLYLSLSQDPGRVGGIGSAGCCEGFSAGRFPAVRRRAGRPEGCQEDFRMDGRFTRR